jgi:transposase
MTTELAWSWIRYQSESALSCWFRARFGGGGKRLRRIGIVAVARKLLIALWHFLETGVWPEGPSSKRRKRFFGAESPLSLVLVEAVRNVSGPFKKAVG